MEKLKKIFKSKGFRITAIVLAVLIVIGILIGKAVSSFGQAMEMAMNMVSVVEVEKHDLSDTIAVSGLADGISETNINSSAAAEITAVNVAVGDYVNEGDVICTLDSTEISRQIEQVEKAISNENNLASMTSKQNQTALENAQADLDSNLSNAQSAIDRANGTYNEASTQLKNDQAALDALDPNAIDYETTKAAYDEKIAADKQALSAAQAAIDEAKSAYDQTKTAGERAVADAKNSIEMASYQTTESNSQATLDDLNKQLEDCTVKAPGSGVVTAVNVKVGDTNTPGAALVTIEDTSSLKITVSVDESKINLLQEGMPATVTTTATGDEQIAGTVSRVVKVKGPADQNGESGYTVEVTISNPNVLIGMSAKVKIVIADRGVQLAVPYDSIRYDDKDKPYVLLAKESKDEPGKSIATRCDVELGEEVDYYTEIKKGLKEGDKIVYDETIEAGDTFVSDELLSDQLLSDGLEE